MSATTSLNMDVLCLSRRRWLEGYGRPHHLMSRAARHNRVFFLEEPVADAHAPRLQIATQPNGVRVVTPTVPVGLGWEDRIAVERELLDDLLVEHRIRQYLLWYTSPWAMEFTRHLDPAAVVYDCLDELSGQASASPNLRLREQEMFLRADLVLAGAPSLYRAKREHHSRVYLLPNSVDVKHFARARDPQPDPVDQAEIPHPRFGFAGVLDERLDLDLVRGLAKACPGWQFVFVGPVSGMDPARLPHRSNIHYLGVREYSDLPTYLAGWDAAILPFARNRSTEFIQPSTTLEYLAAGRPVIATPLRDIAETYGTRGLARMASTVEEWVEAIQATLMEIPSIRTARADTYLSGQSWDGAWQRVEAALMRGRRPQEEMAAPVSGLPWSRASASWLAGGHSTPGARRRE